MPKVSKKKKPHPNQKSLLEFYNKKAYQLKCANSLTSTYTQVFAPRNPFRPVSFPEVHEPKKIYHIFNPDFRTPKNAKPFPTSLCKKKRKYKYYTIWTTQIKSPDLNIKVVQEDWTPILNTPRERLQPTPLPFTPSEFAKKRMGTQLSLWELVSCGGEKKVQNIIFFASFISKVQCKKKAQQAAEKQATLVSVFSIKIIF
ncbi:hypothetical protein G9A89_000409 [Geosiphon pyriformis]|nr:hypothetical protein G9A89_000409 [Geosiphon pyriformis]